MSHTPESGETRSAAVIDCEVAVRRLWDFLDGRLPTIAREEVEAHLATCLLCPPHFEFAEEMQRVLANSASAEPGDASELDSVSELHARVANALRRQALASRGTTAAEPDHEKR